MDKTLDKVKKITIKKHKKLWIVLLCLAIILSVLWFVFSVLINPVIKDSIELETGSIITKAINAAVADVVMKENFYDDLINIVRDENNNISLIYANSFAVNALSRDLAQTTERKLNLYKNEKIQIPVGNLFGMPIFTGLGPSLNIAIKPIGSVSCDFLNSFESAGVNQTRHKIYLNVKAEYGVVVPIKSYKFKAQQQILISETVLLGKVPDTYLYFDKLDPLINLIP